MSTLKIKRGELLSEVFTYSLLKTSEKLVWEHTEKFLKDHDEFRGLSLKDDNSFVGIEVEVEGINLEKFNPKGISPFWRVAEDGSLRNNGVEFISVPMKGKAIFAALGMLQIYLKEAYPKHDFSDRTSVHIHVNVRDMPCEAFMNLLVTYLTFETALYKFIFDTCLRKRDENIFCVPLQEAGVSSMGLTLALSLFERGDNKEALGHLNASWKKYAGINLVPIRSFGTVEFRHLGGIMDVKRILTWINLLLSLRKYAFAYSYESIKERILSLNTTSMYDMFTKEVFGHFADNILRYNVHTELEKGVNFVKYAFESSSQGHRTGESPYVKEISDSFEGSSMKAFIEKNEGVKLEKLVKPAKKNYQKARQQELLDMLLHVRGEIDACEREIRYREITDSSGEMEMLNNIFLHLSNLRQEDADINDELRRRAGQESRVSPSTLTPW